MGVNALSSRWEYRRIRDYIESVAAHAFSRLDRIGELPAPQSRQIAAYLLTGTCDSGNEIWVCICRWLLWQLPGPWLTAHWRELLAASEIDLEDDYEFANLLAACAYFPPLAEKLAQTGLQSQNPAVREWAADYLEAPALSGNLIRQTKAWLKAGGLV